MPAPTPDERSVAAPDERPDNPGVRVPPPVIYLAALLAGLALHRRWPRGWLPAGAARPLGAALVVAALVCAWALLSFWRAGTRAEPWRESEALVTGGPYRFTRNPMYLGFTLAYLGACAWLDALAPLLLLPFVLVIMRRYVIDREEAYLTRRFGAAYGEYQRRVRRWV